MPVVIQELVVRVVVEDGNSPAAPVAPLTGDRAALIEAAVRETMRVLRREQER
jgi:hypothetical protein